MKVIQRYFREVKLKKRKEEGTAVADLLADLSIDEYEIFEEENRFKKLSLKNIERAKRVVGIRKHKTDKQRDFLSEQSPQEIRQQIYNFDKNENRIIRQTGIPSFLKKKFKIKTLKAFNAYKGMFIS